MNHTFVGSLTDPAKCRQCKRPELDHTDKATCESCGSENVECEIIDGDILACAKCQERDKEVQSEVSALGNTREERVNNVRAIYTQNSQIEQSIRILPEIFNAKMVAIVELQKAVEADPEIPDDQKIFRIAKIIDERYQHLKQVLLERRKEILDGENEQRAIQQYYNELAKKLRAEEKEQIRLKDVTYQPVEPTKISKPRSPSTKSIGVKESLEWATKLEAEFPEVKGKVAGAIQALLVVKTAATAEAAYNILRGIYSANKQKASGE